MMIEFGENDTMFYVWRLMYNVCKYYFRSE